MIIKNAFYVQKIFKSIYWEIVRLKISDYNLKIAKAV